MTESWEEDLAAAQAELERLDPASLVAAARRAVAEWKPVESGSAFFRPLPLIAHGGMAALLRRDASDGLLDEAGNAAGSAARVLFAEEVAEAEPPAALRDVHAGVLRSRAITARRVLTLPSDDDAGERLGLDVLEVQAYAEAVGRVRDAVSGAAADHWVGGHATGVQGYEPRADTTLLLHIEWDEELGFEFLDGGAIQFRIPNAALAQRDWSLAFAEADSC